MPLPTGLLTSLQVDFQLGAVETLVSACQVGGHGFAVAAVVGYPPILHGESVVTGGRDRIVVNIHIRSSIASSKAT